MRTERVLTNFTCNQNCTWCTSRSPTDAPAFVRGAAVRARVDEALARGAEELVLTGGEPTLRKDLEAIVAYVHRAGRSVALETNATTLDARRATALREAGLSRACVNLSGVDARLDACTRDDGGFARTRAGITALLDAGVPTEIAVTLVRSTLPLVRALPAGVREIAGARRIDAIVVSVPTSSPDPSELLAYEEVVAPIRELDEAAREVGIVVRMSVDARPPPCVFEATARVAHLFAMTRGGSVRAGHRKIEACASCHAADRCAGFDEAYLARFGEPAVHPVRDDRTRRRLSIAQSVGDQIRRELVSHDRSELVPGAPIEEAVVRVQFQCNQACEFCFVSTHLPAAEDEAIRAAITAEAARGAHLVLSGGEPTASARLGDYLRLAKSVSPHPVTVQTNAVRLADDALARALVDAGLDRAFVSLHAARAETSDAITRAPGTFDKTVVGIDRLCALGVEVVLNFVICERNYRELPAYVELVHARCPRALLNLSFVAPSSDVVPHDRALVPRYGDVRPFLAEALARAAALGVSVVGFESMCGMPLCLVPAPLDRVHDLGDLPPGLDRGEFVRTDACRACALGRKCHGLRRGYAELWGTDELRPVPPRASPSTP